MCASSGFNNEQFRLPLVIHPVTYATAVVTLLIAAGLVMGLGPPAALGGA